jgi:hypothetical protein
MLKAIALEPLTGIVKMPRTARFRSGLATIFVVAGILLWFGLGLLADIGKAMSGMGDGGPASSVQRTNATIIALPFAIFFGAGGLAGLIPYQPIRIVLALVGYASLLWAPLCGNTGEIIFLAALSLIIAGVFSAAWVRFFKDHAA